MFEHVIVEENKILGKLPDPFVLEDGTRVKTKTDWEKRKKELYKTTVEVLFGTQPPNPEYLNVDPISLKEGLDTYRITTGTYANPIVFKMSVFKTEDEGIHPAVIIGDAGNRYVYAESFSKAFTDNGITLVLFDRSELAPDLCPFERKGPIYQTYPEYTFGGIGAWAWGYSRCVDALEKLGIADMSCIAFSGHSRGGKTALLAGILDERAAIVNPNGSGGAGGAGCYRLEMKAKGGEDDTSETLFDTERLGVIKWLGPEMVKYKGRETELPFDQHYLKALLAPRILVETNGEGDIWANPAGAWQTSMAAKEVYRFLGAEENIYSFYRKGGHEQNSEDLGKLVSVVRHKAYGTPVEDGNFCLSYRPDELMFDWRGDQ